MAKEATAQSNQTKAKAPASSTAEHKEPEIVLDPLKVVKGVTESKFIREFKEFINRGSIVDLAIGVAVGGAFTSIAKSLVDDIIMPVVGLIMGGVNLADFSLTIPNIFGADTGVTIHYGNFLQNVVNFIVVAFAVFTLVKLINKFNRKEDARAEAEKKEAEKQAAWKKEAEKSK